MPILRGNVVGLGTQKRHQLGQIGRRQIDDHEAPFNFFRNESQRRCDDDELLAVEANPIEVAEPAAHRCGISEWLVEILEVKNPRMLVRRDEIERLARIERRRFLFVLAQQAFGDAPAPDRNRRGWMQGAARFA